MEGENAADVRLVDVVTKTLLKLKVNKQSKKSSTKVDIDKSRTELFENNKKEKAGKHTI